MIKRIKKILKLGIFDDYSVEAGFNDFAKFNLFYGWNGCGKTTLSRLFSMLDKKAIDNSFEDCEFEVVLDDDSIVKSSNLATFNRNIFVFNQHFIEENIDWKTQGAKSIVIISEENIEERNKYFHLKDVLIPAKLTLLNNCQDIIDATNKAKDAFLTASARGIKGSYQLIDTSDRRYMNYDRTKFRTFIEENKNQIMDPGSILNAKALEELKKRLQPIFKAAIDTVENEVEHELCLEHETAITKLLSTQVVSEVIERLKTFQDINSWVEQGLVIHQEHESTSCEFCTQDIPPDRVTRLKKHFNDAYARLINSLSEESEWLKHVTIASNIPDSSIVYEEFQAAFIEATANLKNCEANLAALLAHWQDRLKAKQSNVFDTTITLDRKIQPVLTTYEAAHRSVTAIIRQHNAKAEKFVEQLEKDKARIELHFAADVLKDGEYFNMLAKIESEQVKLKGFEHEVGALEETRKQMEAKLANVAKGADDFNIQLHRFLGRDDISLVYDTEQKGYKIKRAGQNRPAHHLSEGEKTAIAFVYFSIKIKENGNRVEESIIVVDDPISSFDSTYLFNSFAYLKYTCETAKQLFVLTHNFQYFKLVRNWMMSKNKKDVTPKKSQAYSIDVLRKQPRQSALNNAHETLLNHGSEYHFFFRKLYSFKDTPVLNVEEAYQVANYARKMLEAFFSFKHPRKRNDFLQLMSAGCDAAGVNETMMNRIYRFINAYSHNDIVEFHDSTADNLLAEGNNITAEVLLIMQKSDPTHYNELVEMCV